MKKFYRIGILLVIFSFFVLPVSGEEKNVNQGEIILKRVSDTYKAIKVYQDDTVLTINVSGPGIENKTQSIYSVILERPDKAAIILKSGMRGSSVYSNGEQLWTYTPMTKSYKIEDAHDSLQEILDDCFSSIVVFSLFGDNPYEEIMEGVEKLESLQDELADGKKTHHLRLIQEESDIDLWINSESFLINKVKIDLSKMMTEMQSASESKMKMFLEEAHSQIKINQIVPPETFVFTPPEGAVKTALAAEAPAEEKELSPLVGTNAADFAIESLKEGDSIKLSEYRNKVVLLDFWAIWCAPCREELPRLEKIHNVYKDKDFVFIAVNVEDETADVREFITENDYTFPVALDKDGKVFNLYNLEDYPTLVLIDKQGTIQRVYSGYRPNIYNLLKKDIDALLAGKSLIEVKNEKEAE